MCVDTLVPGLRGPELYVVTGEPVHLGGLLLGLGGMVAFTALNYGGGSATLSEED